MKEERKKMKKEEKERRNCRERKRKSWTEIEPSRVTDEWGKKKRRKEKLDGERGSSFDYKGDEMGEMREKERERKRGKENEERDEHTKRYTRKNRLRENMNQKGFFPLSLSLLNSHLPWREKEKEREEESTKRGSGSKERGFRKQGRKMMLDQVHPPFTSPSLFQTRVYQRERERERAESNGWIGFGRKMKSTDLYQREKISLSPPSIFPLRIEEIERERERINLPGKSSRSVVSVQVG